VAKVGKIWGMVKFIGEERDGVDFRDIDVTNISRDGGTMGARIANPGK